MTDRELMQQALDAMLNFSNDISDEMFEAMKVLKARLAQPEPEPVAQMREMLEVQGRDGTWNYDTYSQGMYNGMEFMVALAEGREPVFREPPERWLHTPPQREWQGLTDEEIDDIAGGAGYGYINVARAIEAKLKEKNIG